jgi:hypothetical protein
VIVTSCPRVTSFRWFIRARPGGVPGPVPEAAQAVTVMVRASGPGPGLSQFKSPTSHNSAGLPTVNGYFNHALHGYAIVTNKSARELGRGGLRPGLSRLQGFT